jgi:hypothetical protein
MASLLKALRLRPAEEKGRNPAVADVDVEGDRTEKDRAVDDAAVVDSADSDRPGEDLQRGVQEVEAVTLAWSKATLIGVFFKYVVPPSPSGRRQDQWLTLAARFQHLAALPRQRFSVRDPRQLAPLRHERL